MWVGFGLGFGVRILGSGFARAIRAGKTSLWQLIHDRALAAAATPTAKMKVNKILQEWTHHRNSHKINKLMSKEAWWAGALLLNSLDKLFGDRTDYYFLIYSECWSWWISLEVQIFSLFSLQNQYIGFPHSRKFFFALNPEPHNLVWVQSFCTQIPLQSGPAMECVKRLPIRSFSAGEK